MSSCQRDGVSHKSEGCSDDATGYKLAHTLPLSLFTTIDPRCLNAAHHNKAEGLFESRFGRGRLRDAVLLRQAREATGAKKIQKRIHPLHFTLPLLSPAGSWKCCDGLKQWLPLVTHPCGMLAQTGSLLYSSQLTTKNSGLKRISVCWFQNAG